MFHVFRVGGVPVAEEWEGAKKGIRLHRAQLSRGRAYLTPSSSTSKMRVDAGGMTGGKPRSPYA